MIYDTIYKKKALFTFRFLDSQTGTELFLASQRWTELFLASQRGAELYYLKRCQ